MRISRSAFWGWIIVVSFFLGACKSSSLVSTTHAGPTTEEEYHQQIQLLKEELAFSKSPYQLPLSREEVLLDSLLHQERKKLITSYKENEYFPPARYFFGWKDHMETTRLFQVFSDMPKGGILHLHGSASLTAEWIMDKATELEEAYVYWGNPSGQYNKGYISVFPPGKVPEGFFRPDQLSQKIPDFKESWYDKLTLDASTDADSVDIWGEFEGYFESVYAFLTYRPVYEEFYRASFKRLMSDGIQHVELRNAFRGMYDLEHDQRYYTADSMIFLLKELRDEMREIDPSFSLSLIYSNLRRFSTEVIQADMERAIQLRKKYPEIMKGYDLVGEEDAGHHTGFFARNWAELDELEEAYHTDLPLYLHNGESNWATNDNLIDTYLLDSRRIGHGFNLYRFPTLWEKLKEREVCIEICPISNQVLGYVRDLRNHPGLLYIQLGIPVTISSDDPSIFQYKGVSPDFWAIYLAWNLDLSAVKKLCQNSIIYSTLTDSEKEQALISWEKKWVDFVSASIRYLQAG